MCFFSNCLFVIYIYIYFPFFSSFVHKRLCYVISKKFLVGDIIKDGGEGWFQPCLFVCLIVCLFVGIKPEKLYSASCVERKVNPLGVITHGQRHKPRAYQRQRYRPHTCQSMVNTLQVDGLARISGLTPALYKRHPEPPKGIPPCLVWWIGFFLSFFLRLEFRRPNLITGLSKWRAPD